MARTNTKRTHAPKPNQKEQKVNQNKRDNTKLATTEPTAQDAAFAKFIKSQTGVDVDVKTVQLARSLRAQWNKSDDNASFREQRKEERAQAKQDRAKKQEERRQKSLERLMKQAEKLGVSVQTVRDSKK